MKLLIFSLLVVTQVKLNYASFFQLNSRCIKSDFLCLTSLARSLAPSFWHNIPEPMVFDSIRINEEGLNLELKDLKLHGFSKLNIDQFSLDPVTNSGRTIFSGDLYATARYNCNGTIFSVPIFGDGDMKMELKNVEIESLIQHELSKGADGLLYPRGKNYQFRYDVRDNLKTRYNNLYNGNKELSDIAHYIFEQNWKLLTEIYGRSFFRAIMDRWFYAKRDFLLNIPVDSMIVR